MVFDLGASLKYRIILTHYLLKRTLTSGTVFNSKKDFVTKGNRATNLSATGNFGKYSEVYYEVCIREIPENAKIAP